jgi:hypothetical protein
MTCKTFAEEAGLGQNGMKNHVVVVDINSSSTCLEIILYRESCFALAEEDSVLLISFLSPEFSWYQG